MYQRKWTKFARNTPEVKFLLERLITNKGTDEYRDLMRQIGNFLAKNLIEKDLFKAEAIQVICTVEDADFLARGVIEALEEVGLKDKIRVLCLWNKRVKDSIIPLAPIILQYEEPVDTNDVIHIVVKSIISGSCVVKTNLARALSKSDSSKILIVAPVMLNGAKKRLNREFSQNISKKFKYVWFATDFQKQGETVVPGVGGSVYQLLGLGDETEKNKYIPHLIEERKDLFYKEHAPA